MNYPALFFLVLIPLIATAGIPRNATVVLMALCAVLAAFSGAIA